MQGVAGSVCGGGGGAGRDQDWSDETKDLEMRKLNILELNQ